MTVYSQASEACRHCSVVLSDSGRSCAYPKGAHQGLCCDCFDLSCGQGLDSLNEERAKKGRPPIANPWPGRDRDGFKVQQ